MEEDDAKLVFETSKGVEPIMSFDEMGIKDDLLRGIYNYGFEKPSALSCQNDKSQLTTLTLRLRVSSKIRQSPSAAPPCPDPTTRGQGGFAQSQSDYKEPYSDSSCPQIRAGVQLSSSSPQVAANSKRGSDKPLFLSH